MLRLTKKGSKLENQDLKKVTGSYGNCGTSTCNNCGTIGNDDTYDKSYGSWYWDIEQPA